MYPVPLYILLKPIIVILWDQVLASEHDHDDPEMQSIKNQEIEDIFNELEGTDIADTYIAMPLFTKFTGCVGGLKMAPGAFQDVSPQVTPLCH